MDYCTISKRKKNRRYINCIASCNIRTNIIFVRIGAGYVLNVSVHTYVQTAYKKREEENVNHLGQWYVFIMNSMQYD